MNHKRNIYLDMKTLAEAREVVATRFPCRDVLPGEMVPSGEAVGRVLAEPVWARLSSPNFHAAAMDGVAVRAADTFGASETAPRTLRVGPEAVYLNTGNVMPADTDAVIMIEHIRPGGEEDTLVIEAPAFPWQNVRKMGEDIVATELLFPRHHTVSPYCVGALLAAGVFEVSVMRRPRVLIIPTGSELVSVSEVGTGGLAPGQVLETNSYVMGSLVEKYGGRYRRSPMVMDDADRIAAVVQQAAASEDIVLILGGSSAGSEDYSKSVIRRLGEVLVHGVTMMPGKPVVIGEVAGKPVFGIPGYPVSAIVAFEQFVAPLISRMALRPDPCPETLTVTPVRNISSRLGVEEFVRVKLGQVGDRVVATQLPRGAGSITTITEADGIIRIPNHLEGLRADEPATAELLRPASAIADTIVCVGSHDNTLDLLADQIRAENADLTLSSSHVGSMGGLMAVKRGACHLAGTHLLDTTDGSYNCSYIDRYLAGVAVRLVQLVFREQGIIVPRGNPAGIRGVEDLAREDLRFINRQGGSGTRILLDYRIARAGIAPEQINGYAHEEFTHMAVAAAVLSGAADAGMGIFAAARALDLDFVPVVTEQYDLVIPERFFSSHRIQRLLAAIRSPQFKARVSALGGYSTAKTGLVLL